HVTHGQDEGLDVVAALGEWGVGLLVVLETVIPPIPSEVVLPFAGFSASRGAVDLGLTWVAATTGATVGAWILYGTAAWVGEERLRRLISRRWFILATTKDLDRGLRFFERHGAVVVALGRCVPGLRSAVSLPAGLVRMPPLQFTALTALGSSVWNGLL
ncbi:MAG TPA: DedA family protein, partial [Actinotalea sp.]|nr:DedA family protein [Actinotalea sp.]